jgi:hypothetical protein
MKVFLFTIFCALILVACKIKPEELILGKWKAVTATETYEFSQEGVLRITNGNTTLSGSYKFLDSYRLMLQYKAKDNSEQIVIMRLLVSEKELVLIDSMGKLVKYQKAD